jgi:hypothetical protein
MVRCIFFLAVNNKEIKKRKIFIKKNDTVFEGMELGCIDAEPY